MQVVLVDALPLLCRALPPRGAPIPQAYARLVPAPPWAARIGRAEIGVRLRAQVPISTAAAASALRMRASQYFIFIEQDRPRPRAPCPKHAFSRPIERQK